MKKSVLRTLGMSLCMLLLVFPALGDGAMVESFFVNFTGTADILPGPIYTYSVDLVEGLTAPSWNAVGGEVRDAWLDGSRYFCKVQWHAGSDVYLLHITAEKDSSDESVARAFPIALQAKKRTLDYRSLKNGGGKCLEAVLEELVTDGATIRLWECNGSLQQRWKLDAEGHLVNEGGKCLDVHAPDIQKDGGTVQLWECADVEQQTWTFTDQDALVNNAGGKCLDAHLPEFKTDGGRVQIWECAGAPQQTWTWFDYTAQ